jgi:acetyltransferase-like isoleucine patch superfamily enzyme
MDATARFTITAGVLGGRRQPRLERLNVKSTWRDFVGSGILITLILAASMAIVWGLRPFTMRWLGSYHVLVDALVGFISYGVVSALVLRLLLRTKPLPAGEHALESPEFAYWKLLTAVYRLGQGALNWCTPFYMQHVIDGLYGAKVGQDVAFGGCIDDPYRVSVGSEVVLGKASLISGNYLSGNKLVCGPVVIGNNVTVGANSVVLPNTMIGDHAVLMSGSYLMPGTTVPAGETWRGNPARKWM